MKSFKTFIINTGRHKVSEQIAEVFVTTIKHCSRVNERDEGRAKFMATADFFKSKGLPIEAAYPALPFKSSNIHKNASAFPDKGKKSAINRIIAFVNRENKIHAF